MAKLLNKRNPIYIGRDSFGPIIELDIQSNESGFFAEPKILHNSDNAHLITLKNNLKKSLYIEEIDGVLTVNIVVKNKEEQLTLRRIGSIENGVYVPKVELSALELKMLSLGEINDDYNRIFSHSEQVPSPKTDLHTHYTGQLSAGEIYDIALKTAPKTVTFNTKSLVEDGILPEDHNFPLYATLYELDKHIPGFRERIIDSMELNIQDQITFMDMDVLYKNRNPFFDSNDPRLITNYILKIAENYARNGVEYCELSTCTWMFQGNDLEDGKKRHEIFSKAIKQAKEKYGVTVSFLLATPRVKRDDYSLKTFAKSFIDEANVPFVSGIDLLGHEKTSNKDYAYIFACAANMCARNNWKHFTIRSHAGESNEFEDNIKDFLKSIKTEIDSLKRQGIITDPDFHPDVRIGHGLHGGLDDETLALIKETGAIIEINASSNLSLNNVTQLSQIPIKKYLDKGVRVVLGSDGAGLYGTDAKQEAQIAYQLGVDIEELEKMQNFESTYIENKIKESQVRLNKGKHDYFEYLPETVELPGIERMEIQYDTVLVNKEMENNPPIFICGAEMEYPDTEHDKKLKNDLVSVVQKAQKNNKKICIYDDGAYINNLIEKLCDKLGVEVVKLKSPPLEEGEKAYGIDKFEVSRNIIKFYKDKNQDVIVLGGGAFASDIIVNCENLGVNWITDENLPGVTIAHKKMYSHSDNQIQTEPSRDNQSDNVNSTNKTASVRR